MSHLSNPGRFGCLEYIYFGGHYIAYRLLGWFGQGLPLPL